jgi:hypothetical protein
LVFAPIGIILTALVVPGGGPVARGQDAAGQEKAMALIKRLGAYTKFDEKAPGRPLVEVSFEFSQKPTDADLATLKALTKLRRLAVLDAPEVTDAGLEHVKGLPELDDLYLGKTGITDDGLKHVAEMTKLRKLSVRITAVGNKGFAHLAGLKKLEHLDATETKVTDDGLKHLAGLTELRNLELSYTKVSDDGLAHLEGLTKLETLRLNQCPRITGKAVPHLNKLTGLRLLELTGTGVRVQHAGDFRLPKTRIIYDN